MITSNRQQRSRKQLNWIAGRSHRLGRLLCIVLGALFVAVMPMVHEAIAQPGYNLSISTALSGRGTGKISVSPGYGCTGACTQRYDSGIAVMLTPQDTPGAVFTGWNGCDMMSDSACFVWMNWDRSVTANYYYPLGSISGQVRDSAGNPAPNVYVRAIPEYGVNFYYPSGSPYTDVNGNFRIPINLPDNYRITYQRETGAGPSGGHYFIPSGYFDGKTSVATADLVTVAGSAITDMNGAIPLGGAISGTVTDPNGSPLGGVLVQVFDYDDQLTAQAITDFTGYYRVYALATGSYKIRFGGLSGPTGTVSPNFVTQTNAQFVPVTEPQETTGINAILMPGHTISGTITDEYGSPVLSSNPSYSPLFVWVYDLGGHIVSKATVSSGKYTATGIPEGQYKVLFDTAYPNHNYSSFMFPRFSTTYYGGGSFDTAGLVTVTSSDDTTGIDAVLSVTGPVAVAKPPAKDFGAQTVNAPAVRTFTISNGGTADLAIGPLTIDGSDFTVTNDRCSGATLRASGECPFQVTFAPTSEGDKTATISIPTNDPATPVLHVSLSGSAGTGSGASASAPVPYGDNVVVAPTPKVQLSFDTVSSAEAEIAVAAVSSPAAPVPANVKLLNGASYEISTNATFSGTVSLCIDYEPGSMSNLANEANLKLFHYTDGSWQDITTSVDTVNKKICGNTSSFSPFTIVEPASTYTIAVAQTANGTISPDTISDFQAGASQSYSITPQPGYRVDTLTVDGSTVPAATSYTFTNIQADHTITATFVANPTYTLTASSTGSGVVSPAGTTMVNAGASQTYTVTPAAGYVIDSVAVNGAAVHLAADNTYTFTKVKANATFTVRFVPVTYTITVTQSTNGVISPYTFNGYLAGATRSYSITPRTGYHVDTLMVDGSSVPPATTYTFTNIQANHTITASFAANPTYTLTASSTGSGSISPAGTTSLLGGQGQTYNITPAAGYRVSQVLVDGVNVGAVTIYWFQGVAANHTIAASFIPDTYTLTASSTGSGTISPTGTMTVNGGASQTYTVTPAAGYVIESVAVNGAAVHLAADSTYTFTNIRANATFTVRFVPVTYTITVSQTANGTISPYTYSGFPAGATQSYTITAKSGYRVDTVTVDGQAVTPAKSYTITNIQANHSISATFAPL